MGTPVDFPGRNFTYGKPLSMEEDQCVSLPVMADRVNNVSCWKLSPAELEEVARTGTIWLNVMSGRAMFPVFVGSLSEVNRLVADGGLVAREPQ